MIRHTRPKALQPFTRAAEPVALCHKIALVDLAPGAAVIKYGQCIGKVTVAIRRGGWVHVHNVKSRRAQGSR